MTLIKSTDGAGWVEARLNDRVTDSVEPSHDNVCTIVMIDDSRNVVGISNGYFQVQVCADALQLIERPFQVGDEFEFRMGMNWYSGNWKKPEYVLKRMKEHPEFYRHSSPLIRPVGGV